MFQLELSNRFEAMQSEIVPNTDIESTWKKLKSTYGEVAEEKLGYKRKKERNMDLRTNLETN